MFDLSRLFTAEAQPEPIFILGPDSLEFDGDQTEEWNLKEPWEEELRYLTSVFHRLPYFSDRRFKLSRYARMVGFGETLKMHADKAGVPMILKASYYKGFRSKAGSYTGPEGPKAELSRYSLAFLKKLGEHLGVPTQTDYHFPGDANTLKNFVDVLQIPMPQAPLEIMQEEGLIATNKVLFGRDKNKIIQEEGQAALKDKVFGWNNDEIIGVEQKPLFIKMPPYMNEKQFIAYGKNLLEIHRELSGPDRRKYIQMDNPPLPQIVLCYRGTFNDDNIPAFTPEKISGAFNRVREMGLKIAMDVSHPLPQGMPDNESTAAIKNNMMLAASYRPDMIFCEAKMPGWVMKCDNDRSVVVDDDFWKFLREVADKWKQVPAFKPAVAKP